MPTFKPGDIVQVKHDFTSPHDHCLQLKAGDRVTVIRSKNKDDEWLAGKDSTGKVGFFPAAFVKNSEGGSTVNESAQKSSSERATKLSAGVEKDLVVEDMDGGEGATGSAGSRASKSKGGASLTLDPSSHSEQPSIGSVPSPRWLAPTHLHSVALFKYFADGHFGFDDYASAGRKGRIFKSSKLNVSDLLKFGKKPLKLPLQRTLWAISTEEALEAESQAEAKKSNSRHPGLSPDLLRAQRAQQSAVENFKNIMRYMGDFPLQRSRGLAGNAGLSEEGIKEIERDALRSKVIQLGLTHNATMDTDKQTSSTSPMVDEIWCQLFKQTTNNPHNESCVAGWELIATIAGVCKPSVELFPCAFQFVHDRCFQTNEVGALAVYTLRQLMSKREADVSTPSARHQANILSSSELSEIALTPLPASVFGVAILELRSLERFRGEVSRYRTAVSDLHDMNKQSRVDQLGSDSVTSHNASGRSRTSSLFESITAEDVQHVTTGGELDIKSTDGKSYRRRYVWVPDTLDCICWCRGDCKNENKFKSLSLSLLTETRRAPPIYGYDTNANNPYIYFSLLAVGKSGTQNHKHSMDFKTQNGSDCERWVQALRVLLQTASNSKKAIVSEARMAFETEMKISLPMAFTISGCGEEAANGVYTSVQRTKNGARVYMLPNGFVLSREIIEGRAGWIIGKDQVSCFHEQV